MYHISREELDEVLSEENYSPENLISLLKKQCAGFFESDAGVWQKYTIEQHTLMVLKQFEWYFGHKDLPAGVDKMIFRLILALHDIGKPTAIANGGKHKQHHYTPKYIKPLFRHLKIDKKHTYLAIAHVSLDPIGEYLKSMVTTEEALKQIEQMSRIAGMPADGFYEILCIFFKSDAGSYTEDAGGPRALDALFDFDRVNRILNFAPEVQAKIDKIGLPKTK